MQVCDSYKQKIDSEILPLVLDLVLLVLILVSVCGLGLCLRKNQFLDEELVRDGHSIVEKIVSTAHWSGDNHRAIQGEGMRVIADCSHPEDGCDPFFPHHTPALTAEPTMRRTPQKALRWRIVSRTPLNPDNVPYIFENQALISFEYGAHNAFIKEQADGSTFFKYMEPLYLQKQCLGCHASGERRIGDVCGAVSLCFNIDHVEKAQRKNCYLIAGFGVAMVACMLFLTGRFLYRVRTKQNSRFSARY